MHTWSVVFGPLFSTWRIQFQSSQLAGIAEPLDWEASALLVLAGIALVGALLAWLSTRRQDKLDN